MRTVTPTFSEEEAYLLHSIVVKNKADFLKFYQESQLHLVGIRSDDYVKKLEALEEKLLAFDAKK